MTFSVVARCADTGMFGVAVSSSSPAVAARCAYARAGVGAVASQNITDPTRGTVGLDLMEQGKSASQTMEALRASGSHIDYRQIAIVDSGGATAIYSGANTLGLWAEAQAPNIAAAGNLLSNETVPQAIVDGFLGGTGWFGDRLIAAMRSGLAAGGEEGPVHSAGLLIVDKVNWPVADLRCDWSDDCPIENLAQIWALYKPQMEAYVQRALDPAGAPTYGVPGDE